MVLDLVFLLITAAISAGLGLTVLRLVGDLPKNLADALALAIPLGLGAFGLATVFLGEIGKLNANWISGTFAMFGAIAVPMLVRQIRRSVKQTLPRPVLGVFDIFLLVVLVSTFLTVLTPVTDGDALCYHLQVPKVLPGQGGSLALSRTCTRRFIPC